MLVCTKCIQTPEFGHQTLAFHNLSLIVDLAASLPDVVSNKTTQSLKSDEILKKMLTSKDDDEDFKKWYNLNCFRFLPPMWLKKCFYSILIWIKNLNVYRIDTF